MATRWMAETDLKEERETSLTRGVQQPCERAARSISGPAGGAAFHVKSAILRRVGHADDRYDGGADDGGEGRLGGDPVSAREPIFANASKRQGCQRRQHRHVGIDESGREVMA